jgi:hypothetical protein
MVGVMMVSFAGCGSKEEDLVQQDLIQYVEQDLTAINAEASAAIERYNEVEANIADMKRSDILSAFNDEIIPNYTTFYNNLLNVTPATTEVQALKEAYAAGAKQQLDGMSALADAIQNNDSAAAQEANEQITQGKTAIEQHRQDIIKLAGEHGISIQVADSSDSSTQTTQESTQESSETE